MIKDPFEYAHKHRDQIVWMSQNTNSIPTSPKIRKAMMEAIEKREYNQYPFPKGIFGLPEAIREDLGVEDYEVLITSGGIEGLYTMNRALLQKGDEVIASDPSFMPIHHQFVLSEAKIRELDIYKKPWKLTADAVNEAVTKRTRMILLIDPLNPLGSGYSRKEVRSLCEIAEDNDLYLVNDITYRDFSDGHALASEFLPDKAILSYSFSKNCGFAGLRIGALLAPPDIMKKIMPYNTNVLSVNVLAQRAALAALRTKKEWMDRVVQITRRNGERIRKVVERIDGLFLPVYPSKANMFVIDVSETGIDPKRIEERLLYEHKIFIRAGSYVSKRFGDKFIRVSFSVTEEQCERFLKAFPEVMADLRG